MATSNSGDKRLKLIYKAKFWIILGIVLILVGFVLAHLSNANLIHWPPDLEKPAHIFFHICGPIFLLFGIVLWLVEKLRK